MKRLDCQFKPVSEVNCISGEWILTLQVDDEIHDIILQINKDGGITDVDSNNFFEKNQIVGRFFNKTEHNKLYTLRIVD